jgi:uncharacterized membrane protein
VTSPSGPILPPSDSGIPPDPAQRSRIAVEALIARVLFVGGIVSLVVVLAGFALFLATGGDALREAHLHARREITGRVPRVFISARDVARAINHWPPEPFAVIALGLTILLVTPVIGVATALGAFIRVGDRDYIAISAIVLAILAASFVFAVAV